MMEILHRFWINLLARPSGALSFRFVLQPIMSMLLAIRAGLSDFKANRPAYMWDIFTKPETRRALLISGWKDIAKIFVLALVLDVAFQWMTFYWVYPFESLLIAILLACLPYALTRGLINRIAKLKSRSR